ncbi:MAG: hypothetical protein ACLUE1_05695 [Adlercreutzia equolifaciens]
MVESEQCFVDEEDVEDALVNEVLYDKVAPLAWVSVSARPMVAVVQRQLGATASATAVALLGWCGIAADLREQFSVDVRPLVPQGQRPAFVDHALKVSSTWLTVFQLTTAESVEEAERARRVIG